MLSGFARSTHSTPSSPTSMMIRNPRFWVIAYKACWSHSRRKFYELADIAASKRRGKNAPPISPVALEAVKRIDVLFDIERGINGKSTGERLATRQELSAPVLADLKDWCCFAHCLTASFPDYFVR